MKKESLLLGTLLPNLAQVTTVLVFMEESAPLLLKFSFGMAYMLPTNQKQQAYRHEEGVLAIIYLFIYLKIKN
jgi:hypothetical protein